MPKVLKIICGHFGSLTTSVFKTWTSLSFQNPSLNTFIPLMRYSARRHIKNVFIKKTGGK